MNQAGVYAPDINFSPAASVYPTSAGGTSAAAASAMSATTNTTVMTPGGAAAPAVVGGAAATAPSSGKTAAYWVGFVLLLLVLVFVGRKAGGEENFHNIKGTFYNFMAITLTAIVGITGMKVIATKYRVPGASDVILAA